MESEQMFRWLMIAIFVASSAISKYHRRRAKLSGGAIPRRSEGRVALLLRVLVALPLLLSFFAYMIRPEWMAWSALPLPVWTRWIGVGVGLICIPLLWSVFSSIGGNISETVLTKTDHKLVMSGPYGWIRHPLYTVAMSLFVSYGLMASNWWMLTFTAIGLAMVVGLVIPREETELEAKFGDEYRAYQKRVGTLVPRVSLRR